MFVLIFVVAFGSILNAMELQYEREAVKEVSARTRPADAMHAAGKQNAQVTRVASDAHQEETQLKRAVFSALRHLGDLYLEGDAEENLVKAREYFEQLTNQTEDLKAQAHAWLRLADIYNEGVGVDEDKQKAQAFFELACNQTEDLEVQAAAALKLGFFYLDEDLDEETYEIKKEDVQRTLPYLLRAADQNHNHQVKIISLVMLGMLLNEIGDSVKNGDLKKSSEYFTVLEEFTHGLDDKYSRWAYIAVLLESFDMDFGFVKAREYYELIVLEAEDSELRSNACMSLGKIYYDGRGHEVDYAKGLNFFKKALDQTENVETKAISWWYFAQAYYCGQGVIADSPLAREYLEKTVECHPEEDVRFLALKILGDMYREGEGGAKDALKAVECYEKVAEQQENLSTQAGACLGLGRVFCLEDGIKRNMEKSLFYYERAAQQEANGDVRAEALLSLGTIYLHGFGIEPDSVKALSYFEKAAQQENDREIRAKALLELGNLYISKKGTLKRDLEKARDCYHRAIEQDEEVKVKSLALMILGNLHSIDYEADRDLAKAHEYYEKAVQLHSLPDQAGFWVQFGKMYCEQGLKEYYVKALEYFQRALEIKTDDFKIYAICWAYLGDMYYEGLGAEKDLEKACIYFKLACCQENEPIMQAKSALRLGIIYQQRGSEEDIKKAKEYYQIAANQDADKEVSESAKKILGLLSEPSEPNEGCILC